MGRRCKVCEHEDRARIELALANRLSVPTIAQKYGLYNDTLYRHRDNHMSPQLVAALVNGGGTQNTDVERLKREEYSGLLENLRAQRGRLYDALMAALELKDFRSLTSLEDRLTKNLRLTADVIGSLESHEDIEREKVLTSEPYMMVRTFALRAVEGDTDMRRKLTDLLKEIEGSEPHFTASPRGGSEEN